MDTIGQHVDFQLDLVDGFRRNDLVRVRDFVTGRVSDPVAILGFYDDIRGGVILTEHVFGFRSWNVADLELAQ